MIQKQVCFMNKSQEKFILPGGNEFFATRASLPTIIACHFDPDRYVFTGKSQSSRYTVKLR